MSSSANPANNAPALSTEPLTHVPPASSTEDPVPSPPPSAPPSTTDARVAKPTTEVPSVSTAMAQSTDPLDKTPALVDSVPNPVPDEGLKSQSLTEVQLPAESTPKVRVEDTLDLTDDRDPVEPMSSSEIPADGITDASIRPAGMYYYSSAFFFSSHHLFLIRHVAI